MCYGENNATHAASYFNTQLYGLWKVADECANHYLGEDRQDLKPDERPHRYTFALAAWHYGRHRQGYAASVDDMMFYASFQVPELSFICNHEAEFRIRVADESDDVEPYYGHFNLDSHRASESATAELSRNQSLKPGTTFVFRVPFRTTDFQGNAALIGNGNHVLSWLVLDYRRAKLAKIEPSVDQPSFQALEIYLRAYLSFLQAAGHHVFLSLPSFSDAEGGVDIHYSEVITHQSRLQEVHGVAITDINKYLSTAWLKAAMLASGPEGQIYDRPGISLAEYQSTWLSQRSDVHFHFTFGPPEVSVLCNDEVVVNFVIDEASFYQSDNFEGSSLRTYMNWKVAVVFDLDYEEPPEEGGNVRRCKIRMAGARLVVGCSTFEGLDMNDDISLHCRYRTAEFISGEYLSILESGGYNLIFEHDRRWAAQGDEFEQAEDPTFANDSTWSAADTVEDASGKITKAAIWHNIIQQSDMYGYEQLTALSETAINQNFHSLAGQNDMLQEWTFEDFFSVTFKPPTVRLRSDGRALITFHLKDGFVRALKNRKPHPQGEKKDFTNWRVTFEVGLGICDHDAVPGITTPWQSVSMLEQSRVRQDIGPDSGATLKHLYLDLRRASFLHDQSYFEGLHSAQNKRFVDQIQAAVLYLREYYLAQFMASGFHVLYTIPLWLGGLASSEHPHRLVHMTFQVYANKAISTTPYTWSDNSRLYQPIIVIVGTCSNRQTLSSGFQYSTEWVAHAGRFSSCGTVGISADLFLRGKLLPIVSEINAATTIIPNFSGIKQSQWNLALTTWSEHRDRKDEPPPPPSAVDGSPDEPLKFLWKHHDKLNYEHTSPSQHIADGVYTVTCDTENSLEIPTIYKQGTMAIDLRGKVTLQLDVHLDNHGLPSDWSSKASVEWTASIVVHSEAAGLVVNVSSSPPMFKSLEYTTGTGDHPTLDPEDLLRAVFPPTVDVSDANIEFSRFARVWQSCYPGSSAFTLCNPVFNAKGDLLFELQPYADPTSPTDPDAPPPTFAFSKMPGGRRDPFGVRRGTNRPHRTASRQTGRAGASTPEPHANGAMRPRDSSRFSMSSRSMSPSVPSGTRAPVPRPVVTTTMPASRSQWNITASEEMTPTKAYSTQSSESAYS